MSASPYRILAHIAAADEAAEKQCQTELLPFFAILWLASLGRVVAGVIAAETFGAEPTLAMLAILFLPLLVKDEVAGVLALLLEFSSRPVGQDEPRGQRKSGEAGDRCAAVRTSRVAAPSGANAS